MPSLLSGADVATIRRLRLDGFATRRATADPAIDLVLTRPTGAVRPVQAVVVRLAGGGGGLADLVDGTFSRPAPFAVATGDRFTLPDGQAGEIATVWPEERGRVRADFLLDTGGRARLLAGGF